MRSASHSLEQAALDATLEALDSAAFVVELDGLVLHTNAAGRELVKLRGADDVRAAVAEAIRTGNDRAYRIVPLAGGLARSHFLVVAAAAAGELVRVRAAQAARRWQLSARQTRVLELVLEGRRNADIADLLTISVRTVEVHLTAIFERAGVTGRSGLVSAALQV